MSSITSLPPELLLEIFEYLSREELVYSVQNVCTSWRNLIRRPAFWEDYVYSPKGDTTCQSAMRFIQKCPMLKHIRVEMRIAAENESPEDFVSAVIRSCCDLLTFCVSFGGCFPTVRQIDALFAAFPNLEAFTITVDYQTAPRVLDRIRKCSRLKKLFVESLCEDCSLQSVVNGCVSLEELFIVWPEIIESDYFCILEKTKDRLSHLRFNTYHPGTQRAVDTLGSFIRLESLELYHDSYFGPVNFRPLANIRTLKCLEFVSGASRLSEAETIFDVLFIDPYPQLEDLTISFTECKFSRKVLRDICRCYPHLKSLELFSNVGYARDTFEDLYKLERLETLRYSNSETITDDDVEHISRCRRLKHLDLEKCSQLTDRTVDHLIKCRHLETLDISHCPVSSHSLLLIAEHLRKLRYLDVGDSATERDLCHFSEKMSSTDIRF